MLPFSRLTLSSRRLSAAVVTVMSSRRLAISFCSAISCLRSTKSDIGRRHLPETCGQFSGHLMRDLLLPAKHWNRRFGQHDLRRLFERPLRQRDRVPRIGNGRHHRLLRLVGSDARDAADIRAHIAVFGVVELTISRGSVSASPSTAFGTVRHVQKPFLFQSHAPSDFANWWCSPTSTSLQSQVVH